MSINIDPEKFAELVVTSNSAKSDEAEDIAKESLILDVLNHIVDRYPDATKAMDKCACAIGEDIVTRQTVLNSSCTVVLLSPVAGG